MLQYSGIAEENNTRYVKRRETIKYKNVGPPHASRCHHCLTSLYQTSSFDISSDLSPPPPFLAVRLVSWNKSPLQNSLDWLVMLPLHTDEPIFIVAKYISDDTQYVINYVNDLSVISNGWWTGIGLPCKSLVKYAFHM